MRKPDLLKVFVAAACFVGASNACDLCAINSATASKSEAAGFVFTLGEQYISAHTLQYNSEEFKVTDQEYLDSSVTHLIPGYNFSRDFGLSLNVPLIRRDYRLYSFGSAEFSEGTAQGLGDISLIARWTPYAHQSMTASFRVNLLAGVKTPTGDTRYLREDVEQERFFDAVFGPGHDHAFSGMHLHDLTLGSGSVDAVFGVTTFSRYQRFIFTTEAQYYLRTEGESGFRFGDTVMVSGGPGVYLVLKKKFTLNAQAVGRFEKTDHASYSGKKAGQTGMTEIYAGPQITLTAGSHFSAQIGADLPIEVRNNGLQVVPDYRAHGSFTWSF